MPGLLFEFSVREGEVLALGVFEEEEHGPKSAETWEPPCELKSKLLTKGYIGEYKGYIIGLIKGDTRILDYCSCSLKGSSKR